MNRNRRVFIVVFIAFTTVVALLAIDMGSRTTAPWNRRRQAERAFSAGKSEIVVDSLTADTLLIP